MSPSAPSPPTSGEGWVVLESGGLLWAVAGDQVLVLGRPGGAAARHAEEQEGRVAALEAVRLTVAGGDLAAERVLAVVPDLDVRPAPGALVRFWPEVAAGLAVFDDRPVVVIDGRHPPRSLLEAKADAA